MEDQQLDGFRVQLAGDGHCPLRLSLPADPAIDSASESHWASTSGRRAAQPYTVGGLFFNTRGSIRSPGETPVDGSPVPGGPAGPLDWGGRLRVRWWKQNGN